MRKKIKTAMTVVIAIQAAIDIARFVGKQYTYYKIRKLAKSEEDKAETTEDITNDKV